MGPQPPPGMPHEDAPHSDAIAQVLRLGGILRRRWLVVVASTVVCVAAAAAAVNMLKPRWKASATIVLHMSGPQVMDKVKAVGEDAEARAAGAQQSWLADPNARTGAR